MCHCEDGAESPCPTRAQDSKIDKGAENDTVLVGGSTRTPKLRVPLF